MLIIWQRNGALFHEIMLFEIPKFGWMKKLWKWPWKCSNSPVPTSWSPSCHRTSAGSPGSPEPSRSSSNPDPVPCLDTPTRPILSFPDNKIIQWMNNLEIFISEMLEDPPAKVQRQGLLAFRSASYSSPCNTNNNFFAFPVAVIAHFDWTTSASFNQSGATSATFMLYMLYNVKCMI